MLSTVLITSAVHIVPLTAFTYIVWTVASGLYNLYLHPLAKFPGPRLAAFSTWWKTNLEVFRGQNLTDELFKLHRIYGDVVRIGPNELHFSRPRVYHEIYNSKIRWSRDPSLYHVFSKHESLLTMMDYPTAEKRRDILQPLFSRKSVLDLQYVVQECVDSVCANIERHAGESLPVKILKAYRCFALDSITSFCFGTSMRAASTPGFCAPTEQALFDSMPSVPKLKHFRLLNQAVRAVPETVVSIFDPSLEGLAWLIKMLKDQVKEILAHPEVLDTAPHPTIFHELVSRKNGREVPSALKLEDEAMLMIAAGTDTASNTVTLATVHILSNPDVFSYLMNELLHIWPDLCHRPSYEELESLPYLRAVIKESLRLSHGVVSPMTRIVPQDGTQIDGRFIPGGTIVGISNLFVHLNPEIFDDPSSFKPERWLQQRKDGNDLDALDRWLVAFGKGPRSCLGVNLGWCEMILILANVFRRFELQLDGISHKDIAWKECYLPHYHGPSLNVIAKCRAT